MHLLRSPQEAYRRVDFDAHVVGADPAQLVLLCYEQLGSAIGTALHAETRGDNAAKSASLTRCLSAITALQMGLNRDLPIAASLDVLFEGARATVLGSVLRFDAPALRTLQKDMKEIAAAFRPSGSWAG